MRFSSLIYYAMATLAPILALAFPCRTEFGAIEVAEVPGFAAGNSIVRKSIQRTKKAMGGQNGRVVCALVPENELGRGGAFSEILSISQTSITNSITAAEFEGIAEISRNQIESLEGQVIKGLVFDNFRRGNGYYCNTMELRAESEGGASAFTIMGAAMLNNHLFSFVAHSSTTDEAARRAWMEKTISWVKATLSANSHSWTFRADKPVFSTVANIDDFKLTAVSLGKTEKMRTRNKADPSVLDMSFEYPKQLLPIEAAGSGHMLKGTFDGFDYCIKIGDAETDAAMEMEIDAFLEATPDAAKELAPKLAEKFATSSGADLGPQLAVGSLALAGRNAVWRDSWQKFSGPKDSGSDYATKTIWLPAGRGRAFTMQFLLRDNLSSIVPVADLQHFNMTMKKTAESLKIQNKKQFKR